MSYHRYAIYDLPDQQPLSDDGASWLGWNAVTGKAAQQPDYKNISRVTSTPRKYGFHATLTPPFRLADGKDLDTLGDSVATLASDATPAVCESLKVAIIGKFLALTPEGDTQSFEQLAMQCVESLDDFRAPLNDAELARRRASGLSDRQEALLAQWGYPYVGPEFRYHITLTGALEEDERQLWRATAAEHFSLPSTYRIGSLALVGERTDGCFELIQRYTI